MLTQQKRRKFYASKEWLKIRQARLQKDHYLCQDCLGRDLITLAKAVHHEEELSKAPERALDITNLVSLCFACHNRRHGYKGQREEPKPLPKGVRVYKA